MNKFINKYKKQILISIVLIIMLRISIMFNNYSSNYPISKEELLLTDIVLGIIIIYYIYCIWKINLLSPFNKKRKFFYILFIIIFISSILLENVVNCFYYFKSPISLCYYENYCYNKSATYLLNNDYMIIIDKNNLLTYYFKNNKGWKIKEKRIKEYYSYFNDNIAIKIYKIDSNYFVYLESQNIDSISDNSNITFQNLLLTTNGKYEISNKYGKFIKSIDNYKIYYNGNELTYTS